MALQQRGPGPPDRDCEAAGPAGSIYNRVYRRGWRQRQIRNFCGIAYLNPVSKAFDFFTATRVAVALASATVGPVFAQTQPTHPSAYATFPTMTPAFPTAALSPCYRYSSFNRTSSCYTGTPYPSYSAIEPLAFPRTTNRQDLPGAAELNEDQVRLRMQAKGYSDISQLEKDSHGIWRGKGTMKDGRNVAVILDLAGNIYSELSRFYIRIEPAPFRPSK